MSVKRHLKPAMHIELHRRVSTEFEVWEEGDSVVLNVTIRMDGEYLSHKTILRTTDKSTIIKFMKGELQLKDVFDELPF